MLEDFLKYQAKTSPYPMGLEIAKASGNYLYDTDGKSYLDFIAGVSACPLGHSHPNVIKAIQKIAKYSRSSSNAKFISLTGSVGKTGTKEKKNKLE